MANWGRILSRGNVEDRRSFSPVGVGGISLTGLALLFLFNYLSGGDLGDVIQQLPTSTLESQQNVNSQQYEGADEYEVFASTVLGSNNEAWTGIFTENNEEYPPPRLVLFRTATQSSCGTATSQVGPHYCPLDETIYLDETFFDELTARFGAQGGDVAEAYVISHEVGHHVQNRLGTLGSVQSQYRGDNEASIRLELQADCYAGIWASSIKNAGVFEPGEIREAMDAASAVGDDRIQQKVTGYIRPESWTHGSSEQRKQWLTRGYESGEITACDTFK